MSDEPVVPVMAKDKMGFYQGSETMILESDSISSGIDRIKNKMSDLVNIKNLSFLLGSGTSSGCIPSMKGMLIKVTEHIKGDEFKLCASLLPSEDGFGDRHERIISEFVTLVEKSGNNLEKVLGVLYSKKAAQDGYGECALETMLLIDQIQAEIFRNINIDINSQEGLASLAIYKTFYQKLSLRNKDLSRVGVFTTNNDILSECALDSLNVNYNNGFGGGLDRVFNPARFDYTFSRKVDANLEKYEPLENMVYLYKLHGSINWTESAGNSFFNIKEIPITHKDPQPENGALIYPTPLKQNLSLGSPYADLIREFQKKLQIQHTVLIVIGYSFSDEHINNVIYQALASNRSISVVVFGNYPNSDLFKVEDRRIYKIYGDIGTVGAPEKIHYFDYIVKTLIPDLDVNRDADILKDFVDSVRVAREKGGAA